MNHIKMNVATLCSYLGLSTTELADKANIGKNHLLAVRAGRARMTADDLIGLSDVSGVDIHNIETSPEKQ